MENRILIIGDEFFGDMGEAANHAAEILLCREANRPMQFSINAPAVQSIDQLITRASADIIGKKAGRIVVGLGLRELKHVKGDGQKVALSYQTLAEELVLKTQSKLNFITLPVDLFPESVSQLNFINETIRGLEQKYPDRVKVFDFAVHSDKFKEKQAERGKFARSIYTEEGKPTAICTMLLALFLQECILKEIKDIKE
ncbi:MAG: hypothetical protein HUK21_09360 [Fibrobacteraceae bacterium]|nr:hypothetical protein [Fibrobacteraceae bacterium]